MAFPRVLRAATWMSVAGIPLLLNLGCPGSTDSPAVQQTPTEAQAFIEDNQSDPNFVLLDVRNPSEFDDGHIEGAVNLCFNCDTFEDEVALLDETKTYLLYCASDNRSGQAATYMDEQGFANLYELTGGINRWKAEGLPTVQ